MWRRLLGIIVADVFVSPVRIGRAIRHRNDWASLLLLDRRYSNPSIRNKLPKWIGNKLMVSEAFGQTIKDLARFGAERRRNE